MNWKPVSFGIFILNKLKIRPPLKFNTQSVFSPLIINFASGQSLIIELLFFFYILISGIQISLDTFKR